MPKGIEKTYDEKREIVERCLKVYANGHHTIESCFEGSGMSYTNFYYMTKEFEEIEALYKKAIEEKTKNINAKLVELSKSALHKKLLGEWKVITERTKTTITEEGERVEIIDRTETTVVPTAADIAMSMNMFDKSTKDTEELEQIKDRIKYLEGGEELNDRSSK